MSLDSSLKTSGNLKGKRNVLKRHERVEALKDQRGYNAKTDNKPVIGLPKTKITPGVS
jgi:small basic protein (TIGR04137 family)